MQREDGPFVARLPREPGKHESCYARLLSGEVETVVRPGSEEVVSIEATRVEQLEQRIARLETDVAKPMWPN